MRITAGFGTAWLSVALVMAGCGGGAKSASESENSPNAGGVEVVTIMPRAKGVEAQALSSLTPVTSGGITTNDRGTTSGFSIVLGSAPTANVTVTPSSSNTAQATVSGALTFTSANWATPQLVTITGGIDLAADGSQNYTISATTASSDANFNGISAALVNGTNIDTDSAAVNVIAAGLTTAKDGTASNFQVVLTAAPLANVTVAINSSDTTLGTTNTNAVVFTSANWSTPQTVTITGQRNFLADPINYGSYYFAVVGPITSTDASYAAMPTQNLLVTNLDTDHELDKLLLFAGAIGGQGNVNGTGSLARFKNPNSATVDPSGNVYVIDGTVLRKVSTAGIVTTFVGGTSGSADGTGTAAQFSGLSDVSADATGNLYVLDGSRVRMITSAGVVTSIAGAYGVQGSTDGAGTAARFETPEGIAIDATGTLYVADWQAVRKVTTAGVVTTFVGAEAMPGTTDGTGAAARFITMGKIAVDTNGNAFVFDQNNSTGLTLRKITPAGVVTTFAGSSSATGSTDGVGTAARFAYSDNCLAIDSTGNIYVSETNNDTIRKVTQAAVVSTVYGTTGVRGATDGTGTGMLFFGPQGLRVDAGGTIYVADSGNRVIRKISPAGASTTIAGLVASAGSADSTGTAVRFSGPSGAAVDASGNIYIADGGNATIRKMTPAGVSTTIAGTAKVTGNADGIGSAASFLSPHGVAVDRSGNVYVADPSAYTVRKITAAGVVTTFAGLAGTQGTTDGVGSVARFSNLFGLATDTTGNVYIADTGYYDVQGNSTIRKITPAGVVSTFAGTPHGQGYLDGTGTAARFSWPEAVACDSTGNVYVADTTNQLIRAITPAGVVTTLAGSSLLAGTTDGTGSAARFNMPSGIAVDAYDNLYVADTSSSTIRKVTAAGVVTTIAGVGNAQGLAPGALPAVLNTPIGIAYFNGVLVIADSGENSVLLAAKTGGF